MIFHSLADVDTFFKNNTNYNTFLEFFNATQALRGYYGDFRADAHINEIGKLTYANINPIMNNLNYLFGSQGANFFELFITWCTSLSESYGLPCVERTGSKGHPQISYLFDKINGLKMSYNKPPLNTTVLDSLKNPQFNAKFNNAAYNNTHLFNSPSTVWASEEMPKDNKALLPLDEKNILVHTDFVKFRGRGFVGITWRSNYEIILRELPGVAIGPSGNAVLNILEGWSNRQPWGTYLKNAQNRTKVLNTSTNKEWDDFFIHTNGVGACIAHKIYMDYCSKVRMDVSLNQGSDAITNRMLVIGASPTGMVNVLKDTDSWQRKYGEKNVGRVMQIIQCLGKTSS